MHYSISQSPLTKKKTTKEQKIKDLEVESFEISIFVIWSFKTTVPFYVFFNEDSIC